jgi:RNA polymerase sigma factor (sigma-70 family)
MGSFDAPVGEGEGTLAEIIGDVQEDVGTRLEREEMQAAVREVLASLEPREREIIQYRYGFVDGETWTYAKISEKYGVSPERIRQIERAAVGRLRLPQEQVHDLSEFAERIDVDEDDSY